MKFADGIDGTNGDGHMNGVNGVDALVNGDTNGISLKPRKMSRSLPFLTDSLGNSLNDRLLFAVPKSKYTPSNPQSPEHITNFLSPQRAASTKPVSTSSTALTSNSTDTRASTSHS